MGYTKQSKSSYGFTLIELIVVIVILGILAGIAVPVFLDYSTKTNESVASASLGAIRSAIHLNFAQASIQTGIPQFPSDLSAVMFQEGRIPENPINKSRTVRVVRRANQLIPNRDASIGWVYCLENGRVIMNTQGADSSGKLWAEY